MAESVPIAGFLTRGIVQLSLASCVYKYCMYKPEFEEGEQILGFFLFIIV